MSMSLESHNHRQELIALLIDRVREDITSGCPQCVFRPFRSENCLMRYAQCRNIQAVFVIERICGVSWGEVIFDMDEEKSGVMI